MSREIDPEICSRVFSASAGMIGVCMTAIGLIRVTISIRRQDTCADDLLALNALIFLASFMMAYWALRARSTARMHRLERAADTVFMIGLTCLVAICSFIVYSISAL